MGYAYAPFSRSIKFRGENMFKNLLAKKIELKAPLSGEIIEITKVSDPVFAGKIVGDGCAIIPTSDTLVAPADGEIVQISSTMHAIGIQLEYGIELLIHVGIDTVELKGKGFQSYIKVGDKVKQGQKLLSIDLDYLKQNAKSIETPILVTNMGMVKSIKAGTGNANAGKTTLMKIIL